MINPLFDSLLTLIEDYEERAKSLGVVVKDDDLYNYIAKLSEYDSTAMKSYDRDELLAWFDESYVQPVRKALTEAQVSQ